MNKGTKYPLTLLKDQRISSYGNFSWPKVLILNNRHSIPSIGTLPVSGTVQEIVALKMPIRHSQKLLLPSDVQFGVFS